MAPRMSPVCTHSLWAGSCPEKLLNKWTRVMPFRLTNGPASFTRLINLVLNGLTWTHSLVYLDNKKNTSTAYGKCLIVIHRTAGLKLKPTKCHFLRREVTFLGHVVSSDRLKTSRQNMTITTDSQWKSFKASLVLLAIEESSSLYFSFLLSPTTNCVGRMYRVVGNRNNKLHLSSWKITW